MKASVMVFNYPKAETQHHNQHFVQICYQYKYNHFEEYGNLEKKRSYGYFPENVLTCQIYYPSHNGHNSVHGIFYLFLIIGISIVVVVVAHIVFFLLYNQTGIHIFSRCNNRFLNRYSVEQILYARFTKLLNVPPFHVLGAYQNQLK